MEIINEVNTREGAWAIVACDFVRGDLTFGSCDDRVILSHSVWLETSRLPNSPAFSAKIFTYFTRSFEDWRKTSRQNQTIDRFVLAALEVGSFGEIVPNFLYSIAFYRPEISRLVHSARVTAPTEHFRSPQEIKLTVGCRRPCWGFLADASFSPSGVQSIKAETGLALSLRYWKLVRFEEG